MSLSKVDPPTAQTDHHKDLKFGMDTHLMPNRGAIEAIFDKLPQSGFMGQGWGTPALPHISTLGQLFKNCLDGPTIWPNMSVHAKFQVFMMIRLGCRGGYLGK